MHPNLLEVLNTSNVNSTGDVVINDEKLLELVQLYPFIYDPLVLGYQDADYEYWGWKKLAGEFNKTYGSTSPDFPFSTSLLKCRWRALQPVIRSLSKSYDINAIPEILRGHVIKLALRMDRKSKGKLPKQFSDTQALIIENIPMVEQLSLEMRKNLEHDVISLLLTTELESQAAVKDYALDVESINQECSYFLSEIGLPALPETLPSSSMGSVHQNSLPNTEALRSKESDEVIDSQKSNASPEKPIVHITKKLQILLSPVKVDLAIPEPEATNKDVKPTRIINTESLLVPISRSRWVPLNQTAHRVRKCVVRLKRLPHPSDDIPLARMKKENRW